MTGWKEARTEDAKEDRREGQSMIPQLDMIKYLKNSPKAIRTIWDVPDYFWFANCCQFLFLALLTQWQGGKKKEQKMPRKTAVKAATSHDRVSDLKDFLQNQSHHLGCTW